MLPNTRSYVGRRVAATLIDYTLVFALTVFYIYSVGEENESGGYSVSGFPALAPLIFWFVYFIITEAFLKGTLGHQLLGLKVVSMNGAPLSFGQVLVRRGFDAVEISSCLGLIAFIVASSTGHNQRIGDLIAKTLVTGEKETFADAQFDFEKQ